MNNKPPYIIQFICIVAVLLIIMTQSFTQVIKMKPLDGIEEYEEQAVEGNFKTYYNGIYQDYLTRLAKQNTGFREFFIRNYNQVLYSCFGKSTNHHIVEGRDHELYLKMYLDEITGNTLRKYHPTIEDAQAEAQKNLEATLRLIDTLHAHGTELLFVFAPSKTAVYPEKMPRWYKKHMADFSLEEYYIELFKEKDIPHIDFHSYFKAIKDTVSYPLYTRTGTHWAQSTIPFVADSILRKIESVTDYKLSHIQYVDKNLTTDYATLDQELEGKMNLLFPFPKPALPNPVFTLRDTLDTDKPNLLIIGDSYGNQLVLSSFAKAFNRWDFWIYNRKSYSAVKQYNEKPLDVVYDANQVLKDADIVLAVFTAPMYHNYMFGFAATAQELYQKGDMTEEEAILMTMDMIRANSEWMKAIEQQAEKLGVSTEENLRTHAKYYLDSQKNKPN